MSHASHVLQTGAHISNSVKFRTKHSSMYYQEATAREKQEILLVFQSHWPGLLWNLLEAAAGASHNNFVLLIKQLTFSENTKLYKILPLPCINRQTEKASGRFPVSGYTS